MDPLPNDDKVRLDCRDGRLPLPAEVYVHGPGGVVRRLVDESTAPSAVLAAMAPEFIQRVIVAVNAEERAQLRADAEHDDLGVHVGMEASLGFVTQLLLRRSDLTPRAAFKMAEEVYALFGLQMLTEWHEHRQPRRTIDVVLGVLGEMTMEKFPGAEIPAPEASGVAPAPAP